MITSAEFQGQALGTFNLLNQDAVWVDAQGKHHDIAEMSVRYKINCVAFMQRRAKRLADLYGYGEIYAFMPIWPSGEMAQDSLEEELAKNDHLRTNDPSGWLVNTPLVKRLVADIRDNRGGADD